MPSPNKTAAGCRRVLIVEDDDAIVEELKSVFEGEGYEVKVAHNGKEAVAVLTADRAFGVLLVDLMMPEMTGWELVHFMRREERFRHLPVIVISAVVTDFAPGGVQGVLKKPINLPTLLGAVQRYCLPPSR